ncbi:MAG TPA: hypothetical protein VK633_10430 [Verrucomicrobiae bacterium]|nr:hypothetical protein [Verrucomicrobiae bacterium]
MIFDDLQSALVARLNWDAYFSEPTIGVTALAENRMDLLSELDIALAKGGLAVVVAITRVILDEHGAALVTITLQVHEIPLINRAASGTQKTALGVLVKAKSLWDKPWSPDPDVWSHLEFVRFELTGVDEEYARVTWTIEFQVRTYLETVVEVLATASGRPLATASGAQLLVSPTAP